MAENEEHSLLSSASGLLQHSLLPLLW